MKAVVRPAARRAASVWVGAGIVGAVIFGSAGMRPHDLTMVSLHEPAFGGVIALTWILMFVPAARVIVRAEPARFLRSLPGARLAIAIAAMGAIIVLQGPWLALWILGERTRGLGVFAATTVVIVAIAAVPATRGSARGVQFGGPLRALAGIYARGVRRRAMHAVVRGAGLSILAGLAGALIVHNNDIVGANAGVLAGGMIAVVIVPAWAGVLLPLLDAHRGSAWLAASNGISEAQRIGVLAAVIAVCDLAFALLAGVAAAVMMAQNGADSSTILAIVGVSTALGLAAAPAHARAVISAAPSPTAAARVVIGTTVISAAAVLALGLLGLAGLAAFAAVGVLALGTAKP
jgi:hypothetical protein